MRRFCTIASVLLFMVGTGALALTLYLWFGEWPQQTREVVDHYRSVAENAARPSDPVLANVYARSHVPLSGEWQAVVDPYGRGDTGGLAARAQEPRSPSDLAEFSFENGLELRVPGDWNTQDPRLYFYRGVVWYKTVFQAEPTPARRRFLWIGAANYRASVFLNGQLLGVHEGGFTPFNFEVSEKLVAGENLLVVRVDNDRTEADVPTPLTDWHNYGGITRDVLLLDVPEVFVRDYEVRLADGAQDRIAGWVQLDGAATGTQITLRIPDLDVEAQLMSNDEGRVSFDLPARPTLWSPEAPRLYSVEIESGEDVVHEEIGFRSVAVRGSEILLNGEPIFLRGISIHEEAPHGQGRAHSREHAETLLGWVRDLGGNFARLAHYPHAEHMARVADRMGILIWEEIPVYWTIDFGNSVTLLRAKRQLGELIARDRNRASVILWSIGNETPMSEERHRFMGALADHVRAEDPSRLVTAALLTSPGELADFFVSAYLPALLGLPTGKWVYRVSDPLAEIVDVQALNEYFGWYYSGAIGLVGPFSSHYARRVMIDHIPEIRIESASSKPMIISELGAGALAGKRAPEEELVAYSEDYQALVYRKQIEMLRRQEGVAGVSPWILKDFRSPLRLYQGVQDHWNRKGLVAEDGRRKQAFDVLRDWYVEQAEESDGGARDVPARS